MGFLQHFRETLGLEPTRNGCAQIAVNLLQQIGYCGVILKNPFIRLNRIFRSRVGYSVA